MPHNTFESEIFGPYLKELDLAGERETVLDATSRPFREAAEVFADIRHITAIGWTSQAPSQFDNMRDSMAAVGADAEFVVGLRDGSRNRRAASEAGYRVLNPLDALEGSDLSLMLLADTGLVKDGQRYLNALNPWSTAGFSHGFFRQYLANRGEYMRGDINVIGMCPKGMGPSLRRLYLDGSGINASIAVEYGDAAALDRSLGWAVLTGAPWVFRTSLEKEAISDVVGERGDLLGEVHGMVEATYAWKVDTGMDKHTAYIETVESLVGPISHTISKEGLLAVYEKLDEAGREKFIEAYNAAYPVLEHLTRKLYADVSSGREFEEVVSDDALGIPLNNISQTDMWEVGKEVRAGRDKGWLLEFGVDPTVAGIYLAGMMAQVNVLRANGHNWSEVVNESIIEAVDSLNPYMQDAGISAMVDGCSMTARRGDRKWAPLWQAALTQGVLAIGGKIRGNQRDVDYFA